MITASAYLKKHTMAAHKATEQAIDSQRILRASLRIDGYRDIIAANYTVWSSLDQEFATFLQNNPSSSDLQKYLLAGSHFLQKDLGLLLSTSPSESSSTSSYQSIITDFESALGALYVLRGSTLGAKYIYQALKSNENLKTLPHFHFYHYCSSVSAEQWPQFQAFLNEQLSDKLQQQKASEAAISVFSRFQEAYKNVALSLNP